MARQARKESSTGIFHVMMRGINHQNIFEEPEDYYQFIATLDRGTGGQSRPGGSVPVVLRDWRRGLRYRWSCTKSIEKDEIANT